MKRTGTSHGKGRSTNTANARNRAKGARTAPRKHDRALNRTKNSVPTDGRSRTAKATHRNTPPRHEKGPCPAMHTCGGCDALGLPYRKQLARKQDLVQNLFAPVLKHHQVAEAIAPICGMGGTLDSKGPLPSPRAFRYKAVTPFAPGPSGGVRSGFFARGTHDIVHVPSCAVEAPGARHILNEVARLAQACKIPAYDEDRRRGILRYAIVRLGWKTDEIMLTIVTSQRNVPNFHSFVQQVRAIDPRITTVAQNVNNRPGNAILGAHTYIVAGSPRMRDQLLDCTFEISPTAFYQTNPQQTETLYRLAIEGMDLRDNDVVLDAYCGSGTIGLCAAAQARAAGLAIRLIGVERNRAGIQDAVRNARLNNLEDACRFVAEDATAFMRQAAALGEKVDALVLDPPRAGSTPAFIEAALALAPRRIVYVSCNPQTQARDLEQFLAGPYRLTRLTPVDMFPHTGHVETVAWLAKRENES